MPDAPDAPPDGKTDRTPEPAPGAAGSFPVEGVRLDENPAPVSVARWRRVNWFLVALLAICLGSAGLRFYGLNQINSLVFDEVYFAVFAEDYRTGKEFFDIAPPLSKYLIAAGISVGLKLEKPTDNTNEAVGERMAPFTYRWMNAFLGSLIPPAIAALAWLLSRNKRFTLLATFLFAADGLYLVDARLALTNTSLVLWGVLAHCVFLLAPRFEGWKRWSVLSLAGVLFGASFGTKWNGLGFVAGAGLVWGIAWLTRLARVGPQAPGAGGLRRVALLTVASVSLTAGWLWFWRDFYEGTDVAWYSSRSASAIRILALPWIYAGLASLIHGKWPARALSARGEPGPIERVGDISLAAFFVCLCVVPFLTYRAIWEPHLRIYPKNEAHPGNRTFLEWQKAMYDAHQATGGNEAHGYCSKWYTWPFLIRPVAYYYVTEKQPGANPGDPEVTIVKDIHAIANPAVCWLGTIALFGILGTGGWSWGSSYVRWLWARPPPESPWRRWRWAIPAVLASGAVVAGLLIALMLQNLVVLVGLSWVLGGLFVLGSLGVVFLRDRHRPLKPAKRKAAASPGLIEWLRGAWLEVVPPADDASWLAFFLVGNYVVNMLPWIGVRRCLFLYHYMEAYLFAILALAFLLPRWCDSLNETFESTLAAVKVGGDHPGRWGVARLGDAVFWCVVALVFVAFLYWLPIFVGWPLTSESFYRRMLLERWI